MDRYIVLTLVACALVGAPTSAVKFPKDLPRCRLGDNECVRDTATVLIKKLAKGDPRINLVSLDPLHVSTMSLKQGSNSPVNIELKFIDVDLHGLADYKFTSIKGFSRQPAGEYEFRLKGPVLHLVGPYTISGQVLVLPIQGKGHSNMTLFNPELLVRFTGRSEMRNGKEYLVPTNLNLTFDITRLHYQFDNLYNGDRLLGDGTNAFLNENWEDIYKELRSLIFDGFSLIVQQTMVNMFQKVPFRDLFAADEP